MWITFAKGLGCKRLFFDCGPFYGVLERCMYLHPVGMRIDSPLGLIVSLLSGCDKCAFWFWGSVSEIPENKCYFKIVLSFALPARKAQLSQSPISPTGCSVSRPTGSNSPRFLTHWVSPQTHWVMAPNGQWPMDPLGYLIRSINTQNPRPTGLAGARCAPTGARALGC